MPDNMFVWPKTKVVGINITQSLTWLQRTVPIPSWLHLYAGRTVCCPCVDITILCLRQLSYQAGLRPTVNRPWQLDYMLMPALYVDSIESSPDDSLVNR
jgi:hypothetical protein